MLLGNLGREGIVWEPTSSVGQPHGYGRRSRLADWPDREPDHGRAGSPSSYRPPPGGRRGDDSVAKDAIAAPGTECRACSRRRSLNSEEPIAASCSAPFSNCSDVHDDRRINSLSGSRCALPVRVDGAPAEAALRFAVSRHGGGSVPRGVSGCRSRRPPTVADGLSLMPPSCLADLRGRSLR